MIEILTRRCRPLKTTAKAPCPIKSLVLYSYSPTWTILLFEWESIMHFCLCTRSIAFSLPNILNWLLIRAQITIQANSLASNGWKSVDSLVIGNFSLAFALISGYCFTCTILWDLYTVWSHWLTIHIKWIFKLSSSHNCLSLFASISIVPYLFTISDVHYLLQINSQLSILHVEDETQRIFMVWNDLIGVLSKLSISFMIISCTTIWEMSFIRHNIMKWVVVIETKETTLVQSISHWTRKKLINSKQHNVTIGQRYRWHM